MWCVPTLDEEYLRRMEDILGLYERPESADEPVVCLDEKPIALRSNARPSLRMDDASLRRDYEYVRQGTANIFCCVQPLAGRHQLKVTARRDKLAFAEMVRDIAEAYPRAQVIHCVLDNLSTHSIRALIERFGESEGLKLWQRFQFHFTPTHASWLNQAEIQISMVSRECLGKRRIGAIEILDEDVHAWERDANCRKRKINWAFTRDKARKKFKYSVSTKDQLSEN